MREKLNHFPAAQQILLLSVIALIVSMMTGAPMTVVLALVYLTAVSAIAADIQGKTGRAIVILAP
jgi:hypothetical protein